MFKQDNSSFKQDINSFKRLIIGVTAYRNKPERTETDQNRPERIETDIQNYRNGLQWVQKRTLQCTETEQNVVSGHTETNTIGTRKGRPDNGRKQVYVCGRGM